MKLLFFILLGIAAFVSACDIEVHVQSTTSRQFSVQVITPNGERSERWNFNRNRQRQVFRPAVCQAGDWAVETYGNNGVLVKTIHVNLDGNGKVVYSIGDDFNPIMIENRGLTCNGQCATSVSGSRSFSGSRNQWK